MTKIYLIRHVESEGNLYRFMQGMNDCAVTTRGWRQMKVLSKRFADIHLDAVYSSDLFRAFATASAIAKPHGLIVQQKKGLTEIGLGCWEMLPHAEIRRRWPEDYWEQRTMSEFRMEGGETNLEVAARCVAALKEIAAENEGKTVAVVSHGGTILSGLVAVRGYEPNEVLKDESGNTSVALLEAENGQLRILWQGDRSHLESEEYLAGEKADAPDITDPSDIWYTPVETPEQKRLFAEMMEDFRQETGMTAAADEAGCIEMIGYTEKEETPVGIVRFLPEQACLKLLYVRKECRNHTFGVQLLGRAVQGIRKTGAGEMVTTVPAGAQGIHFLNKNEFTEEVTEANGCITLKKDLRMNLDKLPV